MDTRTEIKTKAIRRGWSMAELAKRSGISPSLLSRVISERNTYAKAKEHLKTIRRVLAESK